MHDRFTGAKLTREPTVPPMDMDGTQPVRRSVVASVVVRTFALACLTAIVLGGTASVLLRDGSFSADWLRPQVVALAERTLGGGARVAVGSISVRVESGTATVSVRRLSAQGGLLPGRTNVVQTDIRLNMLALLALRLEPQSVRVSGGSLDLAEVALGANGSKLGSLLAHTPEVGMRALHETLTVLHRNLGARSASTFAITDFEFLNAHRLIASGKVRIERLLLERDTDLEPNLVAEGIAEVGASKLVLSTRWRPDGDVSLNVEGFELGELPTIKPDSRIPFDADATLGLRLKANLHQASDIALAATVGKGTLRAGHRDPVTLHEADLRAVVSPSRRSLRLDRFRFATAAVRGSLSGSLGLENGQMPFEFVSENLVSNVLSDEPEQRASVRMSGAFDLTERRLGIEAFEVSGALPNQRIEGSATILATSRAPAIDLTMTGASLPVEFLRAYWPAPLADKLRDWLVAGNVRKGTVISAKVTANLPEGVVGRLKTGARIGPGELSIAARLRDVEIKTPGDLPAVTDASGMFRMEGMSFRALLDNGHADTAHGSVNLAGTALTVPDFAEEGMPASLALAFEGKAPALIALGSTAPLRIGQVLDLDDRTTSGAVRGTVALTVPIARKGAKPADWSADLLVSNGSIEGSWRGQRIRSADVRVVARPGEARIDGSAVVDGVPAKLALVERFGGTGRSERSAALRLDEAARERLGISLGDFLKGPVDVRIEDGNGRAQEVFVDLRSARLSIPAIGWSKGRGVAASATFDVVRRKGVSQVTAFKLRGGKFAVDGELTVDRNGLRSADFSRVTLNGDDRATVSVRRRNGRLDVQVDASSFDARGTLAALVNRGKSEKGAGSVPIDLEARVARSRGFNGIVARDVALRMRIRGGTPKEGSLQGTIGGGIARVDIGGTADGQAIAISAADAGALARYANLYGKAAGGELTARLRRSTSGRLTGRVTARDFTVRGEKRLSALAAQPEQVTRDKVEVYRRVAQVAGDEVLVRDLRLDIVQTADSLRIGKGRVQAGDAAASFSGTLRDANGGMNVTGTFLPAFGLNSAVSKIPLIGLAFGSGRSRGLLGITFALRGPSSAPKILVNPLSLFTPGVLRELMKF